MLKRSIIVLIFLIITLSAGFGVGRYTDLFQKQKTIQTKEGVTYAPLYDIVKLNFDKICQDPAGNRDNLKLESFNNKIIVLSFWATWCGPCKKADKYLNVLAKECENDNIVFVFVSVDEDDEALSKYLDEHPFNGWVVQDHWIKDKGPTKALSLGVQSIPFTFIVSPQNMIISVAEEELLTRQGLLNLAKIWIHPDNSQEQE